MYPRNTMYRPDTNDIVEYFGVESQLVVANEEMSELTKEITKTLRGKHNTVAVIEEIADVLVILSQLYIIYNIDDDDIKEVCDEKIERTRSLITSEVTTCHDYHQDDGTRKKDGTFTSSIKT